MFGLDPVSLATAGFILASSTGCPAPAQNTVFDLQITPLAVTLNQTLTAGQITELKLSSDQQAAGSGDAAAMASASRDAEVRQAVSTEGISFYNGLTQGQLYGTTAYKVMMQPVNGQVCLYAANVTLALTYDPTIYVAAEYVSRPCANQVVTTHENMHVERDLAAIDDFLPRAKQSMQEFLDGLGGQGPYTEDQVPDAMAKFRDLMQGDIENAILPGLSLIRMQYQQGLDTPENYKRQSALCPADDWLPEPPGAN